MNATFRVCFKMKLLSLLILAFSFTISEALPQSNPAEAAIIDECLKSYGGLSLENSQRLQRFKHWSETYEEIPCFTKCYVAKMFDIFNETTGYKEENVIKQFGQPLYNACRHRMIQGQNSCEMAYNGFHCIVNLETDPFILIESMEKINSEAKNAMKDCLHRFDQYEWEHIKDYATFPVREPITCYTKCFIEKLKLFNSRTRQWNIPQMHEKLGVPVPSSNVRHCFGRTRTRNSCDFMYEKFTCFVLAKGT